MAEVNLLKKIAEALKHTEIPEKFDGGPVEEGEVVLFVIEDPDLRKLWVLKNTYGRQMESLVEAHSDAVRKQAKSLVGDILTSIFDRGYRQPSKQPTQKPEVQEPHNPETCEDCSRKREMYVLGPQYEVTNNAFWGSVKASLSPKQLMLVLDDKYDGIAIREGWQVVATPTKKTQENDDAAEDPGE